MRIVGEPHSIHILDDERKWAYTSQDTVEFLIKKIDAIAVISATSLTVTLARITTSKNVSLWKLSAATDVTRVHRF
jgi:hypothetical protein